MMWISGTIAIDNPNRTINYGICKNGVKTTRYGEQTI